MTVFATASASAHRSDNVHLTSALGSSAGIPGRGECSLDFDGRNSECLEADKYRGALPGYLWA